MTKEQLLSWAVQNVKAWPEGHVVATPNTPTGAAWAWSGGEFRLQALANDGVTIKDAVTRAEWEAARAACGITESDLQLARASAGEFEPFVSLEDAPPPIAARTTAAHILQQGVDALSNRAAERDQADGERSMARCVKAFNAMFGHQITEEQGWQFMELLKMARAAGGAYREDDYVDGAAYCALAGEAAAKVRGVQ